MFRFLIRHRYSVLGTVLFHVLLLFFATYTYLPLPETGHEELLVIRFPEQTEQPELREENQFQQKASNNNTNKAVNEAAPDNVAKGEYNEYNREPSETSKEQFEKQLEEELKQLENQVIQEQRDKGFGYTQEEIDKMLDSKKNRDLNNVAVQKPRSEAAYKGNTNITFKLSNRFDVYLYVPVYMCQYGGTVVVNIAVDRNGNVISAKVDIESSKTTDPCLLKAALSGAKATKFNRKSSAPKIQMGSITYQFIEQ